MTHIIFLLTVGVADVFLLLLAYIGWTYGSQVVMQYVEFHYSVQFGLYTLKLMVQCVEFVTVRGRERLP